MWLALIKQYWEVSLFRQPPQNTPYSPFLTAMVSFLFVVLIVVQWMITDVSRQMVLGTVFLIAGSLLLSYGLFTWVLLSLFRLQTRFVQTLTSLLACHTLVHLIAFPLLLIMPVLLGMQSAQGMSMFVGIVYMVVTLLLAIWQFMVSVFIYKHALTTSSLSATLAGLGLLGANILMISFWR